MGAGNTAGYFSSNYQSFLAFAQIDVLFFKSNTEVLKLLNYDVAITIVMYYYTDLWGTIVIIQ